MVERILGLSGEPDLIDEFGLDKVLQGRINPQCFEQVSAESRADDRRGALGTFGRRVESVDARGDGCLQGGGYAHLANVG